MLRHLWLKNHHLASMTYISGGLLQVLVVHVCWDDLCGQRTRGVWLRQLPSKLRLNEVQLPAGQEAMSQLAGNEASSVSGEILDTDLCGRRKLLGNRYHSFPTHTLTGLPSGTE